MKNIFTLVSVLSIMFFSTSSAYSESYWAKTYGGSGLEYAHSIQQTNDGGYIVAGVTKSYGAGSSDFWVLKLDTDGNIVWQKTYGDSDMESALSIQQTSDGGYIVAGNTTSFPTGTPPYGPGSPGSSDYWVLKLDSSGNVEWQRHYGGNGGDEQNYIQQTSDGGYIVAGTTYSFGVGIRDYWILKLDSSGNVEWQKTYGGGAYEGPRSIQQTSDSGFIVAGGTASFGAGGLDSWVLKLDSTGNIEWQKTYGGSSNDEIVVIQQTSDSGYIAAGLAQSYGSAGCWILKLDSSGNIEWQNSYGVAGVAHSIQRTTDGGYIVAGFAHSPPGSGDSWVLKLDSSGNVISQHTYRGNGNEGIYSIQRTNDDGYIMAGMTESFGAGSYDVWVLKIDSNGNIPDCDIVGSSNATVTPTDAEGVDTSVAAVSTVANVEATDVSPQSSSAVTEIVCEVVINEAPVAVAEPGLDDDGKLTLDGSRSYDPDGAVVYCDWVLTNRDPEGDDFTLPGETVSVEGVDVGVYDVVLSVTDDDGLTGTDAMVLAVPRCVARPAPTVDMVIDEAKIGLKDGKMGIKGYIDFGNSSPDLNPQARILYELQTGGTADEPEFGIVGEDQFQFTTDADKLLFKR